MHADLKQTANTDTPTPVESEGLRRLGQIDVIFPPDAKLPVIQEDVGGKKLIIEKNFAGRDEHYVGVESEGGRTVIMVNSKTGEISERSGPELDVDQVLRTAVQQNS